MHCSLPWFFFPGLDSCCAQRWVNGELCQCHDGRQEIPGVSQGWQCIYTENLHPVLLLFFHIYYDEIHDNVI